MLLYMHRAHRTCVGSGRFVSSGFVSVCGVLAVKLMFCSV